MKTQLNLKFFGGVFFLMLSILNTSLYAQLDTCTTLTPIGKRANLGIFGAKRVTDLTICHLNNRLFAAVENPVSVFFSDDSAKSWHLSFPIDSFEFNCGNQGWGGGAVKVLTNNVGWVAVQTAQQGGRLTTSVISYQQGDTGTWKTSMDGHKLFELIGQGLNVHSIALSDYWLYTSVNNYITREKESAPINISTDIFNINTYITGLGSNSKIIGMALANTPSGFPLYFILDTNNRNIGQLYKFDGTTATAISTPHNSDSVMSIYMHPTNITGDTILINIKTGDHSINHFISFDGGVNWNDITLYNNGYITDFDYSSSWSLPSSNNSIIIMPGVAISEDFGATWSPLNNQTLNDAMVISPINSNMAFATSNQGLGIVTSNTGASGTYTLADNFHLAAVKVNKIARTENKSIFYVATSSGLAYTTAYNDTTVANHAKWKSPYGLFPIPNMNGGNVNAVAIDPNDSLHVIAGFGNGFAITTTGPLGFANTTPAGWHTSPSLFVKDIKFVNSQIVVAVVGGENSEAIGLGDIWRSVDGGATWNKVTPLNFNNGNTIAIGTLGTDTVLYVGTGLSGTSIENNGVLWQSTDLGVLWDSINTGPTAYNSDGSSINEVPIYDIAVDPRGIDTLYIAAGSNLHYAFVKSTDGGLTYNNISDATGEGAFTTVTINKNHPDSVYTAIRRDILVYNAITDSTKTIYRGLPGEFVPDLQYGSILVGTSTGFYKITEFANISTSINNIIPIKLDLVNSFPNPFNDILNIEFSNSNDMNVSIILYDLLGHKIANLCENFFSAGKHIISYHGASLKAGNYLIRYVDSDKTITKKIIKIK